MIHIHTTIQLISFTFPATNAQHHSRDYCLFIFTNSLCFDLKFQHELSLLSWYMLIGGQICVASTIFFKAVQWRWRRRRLKCLHSRDVHVHHILSWVRICGLRCHLGDAVPRSTRRPYHSWCEKQPGSVRCRLRNLELFSIPGMVSLIPRNFVSV